MCWLLGGRSASNVNASSSLTEYYYSESFTSSRISFANRNGFMRVQHWALGSF